MNTFSSHPQTAAAFSALSQVFDPEYGIPITDLGLIYDIRLEAGTLIVDMTLTSPHCPAGDVIEQGVRQALNLVDGLTGLSVNLVWEPAWNPERLSPAAREMLGWV